MIKERFMVKGLRYRVKQKIEIQRPHFSIEIWGFVFLEQHNCFRQNFKLVVNI
jgi:hypothetical protein